MTVGIAALTQGGLYVVNAAGSLVESWTIGLTLAVSGTILLFGLLTPIASATISAMSIATALSWLPMPPNSLLNTPLSMLLVVTMSIALGLLGPGAVSLDCRLFGRREIIIPHAPHAPGA